MSGTAYKALGFAVWKGGTWYLRQRYGGGGRTRLGVLAAAVVAAAVAVVLAQRRNGSH